MKKVAIITHSLRYNYGGILQNYALQQVLKKKGYSPMTLKLNRKDKFIHKVGVSVKQTLFRALHRPYNVITYKDIDVLCTNTDKFIEANIVMTPRMNTIDKSWVRRQHFDAFVIGSDQVLHPSSYPKIEEVYLNFIKNDFKLMYAASFGVESWKYSETQTANCRKLVKDFRAVSVRENSAVCHMKEKFDLDATIVTDPTLLLTEIDYRPFVTENEQHFGVVTYILDPNDEKQKIIDKVSSCLGLLEFKANNDKMDNDNTKLEDRITPSVEEWLTSLYNADFIVTDSYHGTLFSIIFKKNFICIGNKKRGLDRFKTILDKLDLTNRMVFEEKECTDDLLHDAVRYDEVNKRLEEFRQQSLDFLSKNLP